MLLTALAYSFLQIERRRRGQTHTHPAPGSEPSCRRCSPPILHDATACLKLIATAGGVSCETDEVRTRRLLKKWPVEEITSLRSPRIPCCRVFREGATACVDPTSRPATCLVTSCGRKPGASGPSTARHPPDDRGGAGNTVRHARPMYSDIGQPWVPPEQLLRALLVQSLYTIRSERLLMEGIDYSILFRWFVCLGMDEPIWSPTTFSKNRDRLLEGNIAAAFFDAVIDQARRATCCPTSISPSMARCWRRGPVSNASSAPIRRRRHHRMIPGIRPSISTANRDAMTAHASTTDPDAMLARKGRGREAKLSYTGHVLLDNRHGLVANVCVTAATGTAEREAALFLLGKPRPP